MCLIYGFHLQKKKKEKHYSMTTLLKIMAHYDCFSNTVCTIWPHYEAAVSKVSCPTLGSSAPSLCSQNAKQLPLQASTAQREEHAELETIPILSF